MSHAKAPSAIAPEKRELFRIARSVKHFLEVLDELNRLEIEFVSFRESIDTAGPLGRAIVVIIGAIAELERSLIESGCVPACGSNSVSQRPTMSI